MCSCITGYEWKKIVDLLQLRSFQAVARLQHVSRAAAQLRVAQPALSRSIARLEAEVGVPLFDRRGRRVQLNRAGARLLARVDRALAELDQARSELHDAAGTGGGTVAVAAETLRVVTDLTAAFLAAHPDVELRLTQAPGPAMAELLRTGAVDVCLVSQRVAGPALQDTKLFSEDVLVAVPPAHRLAGRARVTVRDLAGEPLITPRAGYWQRALADRLFADARVPMTIACEGDEPAAIRGLISAGAGIGLLPDVARRVAPDPPVAWLRLDAPGCRRTLRLVRRDDTYISTAARTFHAFALAHFRGHPTDG